MPPWPAQPYWCHRHRASYVHCQSWLPAEGRRQMVYINMPLKVVHTGGRSGIHATNTPAQGALEAEKQSRGDSFSNWKIYCSEPGVASTNNALETKWYRKVTTLGHVTLCQHYLILLFEWLIVDLSLDLLSGRKSYKARHIHLWKSSKMWIWLAVKPITSQVYKFTKVENNQVHYVDFGAGICSCPLFLKHGYCKHLIYIHKKKNVDDSMMCVYVSIVTYLYSEKLVTLT